MRKFIVVFALFTALILIQPVSAEEVVIQDASVHSNMGLYGGQPESIALEYGTDNAYAALMAPSAIFSTTGSGTWDGLPSDSNYGIGKVVAVDQDTGDAYALIGNSMLKSTDNGTTWTDQNPETGTTDYDHRIVIGHGRILVALNDGSVLIGEGMGTSYTTATIETNAHIWSLAASPITDVYYAVTEDNEGNSSLYVSTDGGASWSDKEMYSNGVTAGNQLHHVGVDPLDGQHIVVASSAIGHYAFQTFNSGTTWQPITVEGSNIGGRYVAWDGAGKMYMSEYYTDDASADPIVWTSMTTESPLSSIGYDFLVVDRGSPETLYVGTGLGVAKSEDRGASWTDIVDGIEAVKIYAFSQAENKDIAWIAANGGVGRTVNCTADDPDWDYPILPVQNTSNWMGLWVKPEDPDIVVAAAGSTSFYRTTNGTDTTPTWTQGITPEIDGGQVKQIIADPSDNTLYAVILDAVIAGPDDGMVLKSEDEGATWTDTGLTDSLPAQTITLTTDGILFAGIGGDATTRGVYMMGTDGVWEKPSTDLDEYEVTSIVASPDDADTLYATV